LMIGLLSGLSWAQGIRPFYNPMDERYKFLALKRAYSNLKKARAEFERAEQLLARGLISRAEYERVKTTYDDATITYQQCLLNLIFAKPHISIDKAIKYQTPSGEKRVELILRNTSGGSFDFQKLGFLEDSSLVSNLKLDELTDVYVSLLNDEHSIISQPYEIKIPRMVLNKPVRVDFLLLQNLDNVIVRCTYADKVDEKKIYLQRDPTMNIVSVNSIQFSQEANLGSKATYDLTLERFSSEESIYKLAVINLPRQVSYEFTDPKTRARLSQVKFTQGITSKTLSLTVYLPEREDEEVVIDKPLIFYALALSREEAQKLLPLGDRKLSEEEIGKIRSGKVKLELIPKGVGRIALWASSLYYEIKAGDTLSMEVTVRNDGTRRLDNIRIWTDNPLGWRSVVDPDLIHSLSPGKEEIVRLTFLPPVDVGIGDQEVRIKTEALADNRRVEAEDKILRIHVEAKTHLWGTAILIILLVGIVVGVVIFGIKISRR